jgi:uncharacterized protein YuzB (UPF0349 family)
MTNVVCCVGSSAGRGLTFGDGVELLVFRCDANCAVCQDTRYSTMGGVVVVSGGAVPKTWLPHK